MDGRSSRRSIGSAGDLNLPFLLCLVFVVSSCFVLCSVRAPLTLSSQGGSSARLCLWPSSYDPAISRPRFSNPIGTAPRPRYVLYHGSAFLPTRVPERATNACALQTALPTSYAPKDSSIIHHTAITYSSLAHTALVSVLVLAHAVLLVLRCLVLV